MEAEAKKKFWAYLPHLRYALYIFFLFGAVNSSSEIISKIAITSSLILIAEYLFARQYYQMFILILIDRVTVHLVDLTLIFYDVFDPQVVYNVMLKIFDFNQLFYLVAVQLTFISFWVRNREIRADIPLGISLVLYLLAHYSPENKFVWFMLVNTFGVVSFLFAYMRIKKDFFHISTKKIALSSLYFIYSLLILIGIINNFHTWYENFNVTYTYPLMILLSLIVLASKGDAIQAISRKSYVIAVISLILILSFLQSNYEVALIQNTAFVALILLYYNIVTGYRNRLLAKYREEYDY